MLSCYLAWSLSQTGTFSRTRRVTEACPHEPNVGLAHSLAQPDAGNTLPRVSDFFELPRDLVREEVGRMRASRF